MSLIKCRECGKEISDKSQSCIHCGCPIEKELTCNECGEKIIKDDETCKSCGCPIEKELTCNECGEKINKDDETCKSCGCPIEKEKNIAIKGSTKIWLIICSVVCFFISIFCCFSFINGNNYNSDDYYYENTTLTQNEQKVYDTLVDIYLDRAYNPQAVRVVSGNTLFGFKISGTNQVGGTITNCISLMPANYRDEDTCSSVHDDVSEDSEWYIDVYKINKKLEEYWNNKGM